MGIGSRTTILVAFILMLTAMVLIQTSSRPAPIPRYWRDATIYMEYENMALSGQSFLKRLQGDAEAKRDTLLRIYQNADIDARGHLLFAIAGLDLEAPAHASDVIIQLMKRENSPMVRKQGLIALGRAGIHTRQCTFLKSIAADAKESELVRIHAAWMLREYNKWLSLENTNMESSNQ